MEQNNLPEETYNLLKLRGLEKNVVMAILAKNGYTDIRIIREDDWHIGEVNTLGKIGRVNLVINKGIVTDIYAG